MIGHVLGQSIRHVTQNPIHILLCGRQLVDIDSGLQRFINEFLAKQSSMEIF